MSGYDENRDDVHTEMEAAAAESKEKAEERVAELQENRVPDYEDEAQNLGRAQGLTGSAAIATPRDDGGAPYQTPRHTATGEWKGSVSDIGAGGSSKKSSAKKASASSETTSS